MLHHILDVDVLGQPKPYGQKEGSSQVNQGQGMAWHRARTRQSGHRRNGRKVPGNVGTVGGRVYAVFPLIL